MSRLSVEDVLGKEAIKNLRMPIETARGLPAAAYTGEAFFELERTRLFPRTWISVAFAHEVPKPGDAVPITAAGVPLILLRDAAGRVRVFHNVCPHRASTVLREPVSGQKRLQCPYHCWTFELDGRLVATPYWDGTKDARDAGLDREARGLVPVSTGVWHGTVFVNLDGKAPPFEEYMRPLDEYWSCYDLSQARPGQTRTWVNDFNWKLYFDNFEMFHEQWVHAGIIPLRLDKGKARRWFEEVWDGCYFGMASPTVKWNDEMQHGLPLFPGQDPRREGDKSAAYVIGIFPNTSLAFKTNHLMITVWNPLGPERTESKVSWFFHGRSATDPKLAEGRKGVIDRWITVRGQDLDTFEGQQRARHSPAADDVIFAPFWEILVYRFQNKLIDSLE